MPPVAQEDAELGPGMSARGPIPRRARFATARIPWWRPRSTFGRFLLGTATLLVLGALVAWGIIVRRFLVHDPHFRITGASSIQSSGLSEVNRAEVLPVFGEDIGRNIFFVPLSERRKQLESIPWVQQATVMRFLPDRLSVSITERTPVAFVREGDRVELADADGVILSMPPAMMAQHHYSFPVITGINSKDSLASRKARMAVYQRFIAELDQNNQHLTEQVSEIDLSDPEDLRATMPEQGADILAHFGEDQFLHRLQIYRSRIGEWRQRYPRLIGVDLRYSSEVPLEMANGATGTVSSTGSPVSSGDDSKPPVTNAAKARAKTAPIKPKTAAHKALEARKKAAKLKDLKAHSGREKVAREKAANHLAAHSNADPNQQLKQGQ
jgi:cell division protein FtsQ